MNTNKPVECLRCHAHMEAGYVADAGESTYRQQIWYPGEPKSDFWMGLKMKKEQIVPVVTLRCSNCGYLESYAIPQTTSGR